MKEKLLIIAVVVSILLHKDDAPDYYKKYGEIYDEFDESLFLADIENYYDYKDPAYPMY